MIITFRDTQNTPDDGQRNRQGEICNQVHAALALKVVQRRVRDCLGLVAHLLNHARGEGFVDQCLEAVMVPPIQAQHVALERPEHGGYLGGLF